MDFLTGYAFGAHVVDWVFLLAVQAFCLFGFRVSR
jgi:hypothetical protein